MGLISPYLFKIEILIRLCHSEISEICLLVVNDKAAACLKTHFSTYHKPDESSAHIHNPSFYDSCNHSILLLC